MTDVIPIEGSVLLNHCQINQLPVNNNVKPRVIRTLRKVIATFTEQQLLDVINIDAAKFELAYLSGLKSDVLAKSYLELRNKSQLATPVSEPSPATPVSVETETTIEPTTTELSEKKKKKKKKQKVDVPDATDDAPILEPPKKLSKLRKDFQEHKMVYCKKWITQTPYFPSVCQQKHCFLCLTQFLSGVISPCTDECTHLSRDGFYPHTSKKQLKRLILLHANKAPHSIVVASHGVPTSENFGFLSSHYSINLFRSETVREKLMAWAHDCNAAAEEDDSDLSGSDDEQQTGSKRQRRVSVTSSSHTSLHIKRTKHSRSDSVGSTEKGKDTLS